MISFNNRQLFRTIIICYAVLSFIGLAATIFRNPLGVVFYSIPIFRLPEFIIGVCLYLIDKDYINIRKGLINFSLPILIIYFGLLGRRTGVYSTHDWIVLPVIACLIFHARNNELFINKFLSSRIMVYLGKISYCFYSLQAFLLIILSIYHDRFVEIMPVLNNNILLCSASLAILILFSTIAHYFIENPARLWIKKYIKERANNIKTSQFLKNPA